MFPWSISSLRSSAASPDGRSPSSAVASAWGVFSRRLVVVAVVAERDARRRAHGFTELIEQLLCQFVRFANDVSVLFELRLGVRERFFERRRLGDDVRPRARSDSTTLACSLFSISISSTRRASATSSEVSSVALDAVVSASFVSNSFVAAAAFSTTRFASSSSFSA